MEMSSHTSSALKRRSSEACADSSASHASLAGCRESAIFWFSLLLVSDDRGVLGLYVVGAVLVRGATGHVVAAVGVGPRRARRVVAVLGLDQALVRGRVRNLGVLAGRELPAQDRDDLAAEQLELVEHLAQGQARVVHQPELALVVAEVLAEGERLVDDLLGGPHGERRHLGEVLERRAVAVDRGLVKVRAELLLGVLGVLGDERLAAEADDRLLLGPVAVVGEALPVELDQPRVVLLRPEDVVGA